MDVALVIIFVVVFYILPIIFKSKNPKKYEYPDVPRRVPVPAIPQLEIPNLKIQGAQHADVEQVALPNSATDLEVTSELVSEPIDAWQGKLTQTAVLNGIIFAEILKPPKALWTKRKR